MVNKKLALLAVVAVLAGCSGGTTSSGSSSSNTEQAQSIYNSMSLDEKIGQLIQPNYSLLMMGPTANSTQCDADLNSSASDEQTIKDCGLDQIAIYHIGSILQGGGPLFPDYAPTADNWAKINRLSTKAHESNANDPLLLIGNDAIHVNMHVQGGVMGPHNIGLGAGNDPKLVESMEFLAAQDSLSTGFNWVYAPTVAQVHDLRWGRSYEGFSSNPEIVYSMAMAEIKGLEHQQSNGAIMGVLATAKHFIGDGDTQYGLDEGDDQFTGTQAAFWQENARGYEGAVNANVGSMMASFSAIDGNETRMHFGGKWDIINQFKNEGITGTGGQNYKFPGVIVSDWNGATRAAYLYTQSTGNALSLPQIFAKSINGGVDVQMVAYGDGVDQFQPISLSNPPSIESVGQVFNAIKEAYTTGLIPESKLHDSVMRILEAKIKMSSHVVLPTYSVIQQQERPLALQAARQSLVLLKNESAVLPVLAESVANIVFVGSVNDLGIQDGGWTINWQGQEGNQYFSGADAISSGAMTIESAVKAKLSSSVNYYYVNESQNNVPVGLGGESTLVISVVNEPPYAEYMGDIANNVESDAWYYFGATTGANQYMGLPQNNFLGVTFSPTESTEVATLKANGAKVVTVIYSGRPVILSGATGSPDPISNVEIAAFLPGTTGGQAVSDAIFGDYHFGSVNSSNNVSNKLPFPWPADMTDVELHFPTGGLYPLGYGLTD